MNSTPIETPIANPVAGGVQAVVASYRNHTDAELAVRRLADGGLPLESISIIGRNYETHEDVQGFYRPADAVKDGAGQGAWVGGLFGLMLGAMGFFILPVVGGLMVMGPLSGLIAGAIAGAGVGALVNGLTAAGVPREHALRYQSRLEAGEFLVVVHGTADLSERAHTILQGTEHTDLHTHVSA